MISAKEVRARADNINQNLKEFYINFIKDKIENASKMGRYKVVITEAPYCYFCSMAHSNHSNKTEYNDKTISEILDLFRKNGFSISNSTEEFSANHVGLSITW